MRRFAYKAALLMLALPSSVAIGDEMGQRTHILGSLNCSSTACHGRQPDYSSRPRLREEFSRWLQSDPHARAKETLASEEYEAILVRISRRDNGQIDQQVQARCATCHDPLGMTASDTSHSSFEHGIGCESCHGNAEKWLARHYERDVERSELLSLGMIDTKNLQTRGRLCASCHVGSEEQDVNHDMIAAGHPPLRFELAAYHDLIPHKHWDDSREQLEKREFQVQLWAAGQQASAQASLEVLEARCAKATTASWPEFAEYNCFSCHRTVAGPRSALAGRPTWSRWNFAFVDEPQLGELGTLFNRSFPPDAAKLRFASEAAREGLIGVAPIESITADELLQTLSTALSDPDTNSDWETRCQQYLALLAAERAYRDELAKAQHFARLPIGEYDQRLTEHRALAEELVLVRTRLQFESGSASTVLRDEPALFDEHRQHLRPQLRSITEQLRERMRQLR